MLHALGVCDVACDTVGMSDANSFRWTGSRFGGAECTGLYIVSFAGMRMLD